MQCIHNEENNMRWEEEMNEWKKVSYALQKCEDRVGERETGATIHKR